jgi:hypothetical protein
MAWCHATCQITQLVSWIRSWIKKESLSFGLPHGHGASMNNARFLLAIKWIILPAKKYQVNYTYANEQSHTSFLDKKRGILLRFYVKQNHQLLLFFSGYSTEYTLYHYYLKIYHFTYGWHTKNILLMILKNQAVGSSDVACSDWSLNVQIDTPVFLIFRG